MLFPQAAQAEQRKRQAEEAARVGNTPRVGLVLDPARRLSSVCVCVCACACVCACPLFLAKRAEEERRQREERERLAARQERERRKRLAKELQEQRRRAAALARQRYGARRWLAAGSWLALPYIGITLACTTETSSGGRRRHAGRPSRRYVAWGTGGNSTSRRASVLPL